MVQHQQPEYDIVERAGHLERHPEDATHEDIRRMASRILNDQKNSPDKNKVRPSPTGTANRVAQVKKRLAAREKLKAGAEPTKAGEVLKTLKLGNPKPTMKGKPKTDG